MFERLDNCPVCDSGQLINIIICKDHTVSKEDFVIVKCDACSFHFTNPRPSSDQLGKYYESEEYISHQDKGNSLINQVYKIARNFTLKGKKSLVSKYYTQGNILDIGCGTGHFLNVFNTKHWKTYGIEPNQTAREQAQLRVSNTFESIDDLPSSAKFDIITMWHVLEHVPDLNDFLKKVNTYLSKKGVFIVAVPNMNSLDAKIYKSHWAAYDVPRHLSHFTQPTLKKLMLKHSLKVVDIKPMKLDAFYVSMLSEKYKNGGKNNYVAAIKNGLKSNRFARENNQEYSSLIYIIKKK
ncbi:class I SAM-dependent methyltransferase [Fulvivirga sp. RKSG066]|uniref:class I SAM-dependent methyltransferase n=1 Tax=Fulvivirga aurantia TaxID=2529383 RepID=UPI0012BD15A0|nr:class I SAM-dependent methyltransferase [Fulvivirga aurantia]MTI19966.1 class I SAM-dependent methyltransferase [Fulvivirga aurantia]